MLKSLLVSRPGRIYVYLDSVDISKRFLQDAENEGFTFKDGTKPTCRHTSDIIAINADATINYVGFVGRLAFQAAKEIDGQPLVKIDYAKYIKQK